MGDTPRNVLFVISDQHRWDHCGFAGHPVVRTPNLDRLAAAGTVFTNAYCPSPVCVCSRAAMMTGRHLHRCGEINSTATHSRHTIHDLPTLGTVFGAAGYATGAIGKVHIPGETRDEERTLGFAERALRIYTHWFQDYIDVVGEEAADAYATYRKPLPRFQTIYNPTNAPVSLDDRQMYDTLVVDRCIEFMEKHAEEPFFLWAGLEKPHTDWTAPAEFHTLYSPEDALVPPTVNEEREDMPEAWYISTRQTWTFDEAEIPRCIAAYYANVTYLDAKVGVLLDALERLGLRENTLVVYTTDHGEMLFDHGMVQKQNFFEGSVHVPFVVASPDHAGGNRIEAPVSLLDTFPTFCDFAGVEPPAELDGLSLAGALAGDAPDPHRAVFAEYYAWGMCERMIVKDGWKYVCSDGEICQLYHVAEDPHETVNLIDRPAHAHVQDALHQELMASWQMPDKERVRQEGRLWNDKDEWRAGYAAWQQRRRSGTA